ncbi:MAG: S-layer protein [Clostridia bacterium]|nr:S-layer protein [Clostridia bacterium]
MKHFKLISLSLLIISMLLMALPLGVFAADNNENYNDINGTWSQQWVNNYGYQEIFSKGNGNFSPDADITRMEFARLLHKALGININYFAATDISDYFNDVKNSDAGASALYDLVTCGIIDTKTSFRPNDPIMRDEMIHFVMRAFDYKFSNYAFIEIYRVFADDSDIRPEYGTDIQHACILGLIKGKNDNYLFPLAAATRAEGVTVVGRLAELWEKADTNVDVSASVKEENGGLKLSLTIANNSDRDIIISHSSTQLFDFGIYDSEGETLYFWSANKMFATVVTETKIAAGEKLVLGDTLSAEEYSQIKDNISYAKGFITGTSPDFSVQSDGYMAAFIA